VTQLAARLAHQTRDRALIAEATHIDISDEGLGNLNVEAARAFLRERVGMPRPRRPEDHIVPAMIFAAARRVLAEAPVHDEAKRCASVRMLGELRERIVPRFGVRRVAHRTPLDHRTAERDLHHGFLHCLYETWASRVCATYKTPGRGNR
jgi:hypothetical protein